MRASKFGIEKAMGNTGYPFRTVNIRVPFIDENENANLEPLPLTDALSFIIITPGRLLTFTHSPNGMESLSECGQPSSLF